MNLDFQTFQHRFAQNIRDPRKNSRPEGAPARRMKVYNELVYNNIEDVLAGCFPVLKLVLGKQKWRRLVREFFSEHICHRPFYRQVPDEFIDYLQGERDPRPGDPIFIKDLAHYEWIELVLFLSNEEIPWDGIHQKGDLLKGRPAFTPHLRCLSYAYPVHRIGPKYQPKHPDAELSHYLIFRNQKDEVQFIVLNSLTARLVDLLLKSSLTGKEALQQINLDQSYSNEKVVFQGGLKILNELLEQQAIVGTWR